MDFRQLEIGKRIIVEKSSGYQEQFIRVGERGTITNITQGNGRIILDIIFDSGEELVLDSLEFNYQVY